MKANLIRMKQFCCVGLLFVSISTQAQMLDSLSGLAVQGALTGQSASSAAQGLSLLKQTQILQDLNQVAMEIKMTYMNGYQGVSKASVLGQPFQGLSWSIGSDTARQFYIELSDLDQATCRYLATRMTSAQKVQINTNGSSADQCQQTNTIRFVFD